MPERTFSKGERVIVVSQGVLAEVTIPAESVHADVAYNRVVWSEGEGHCATRACPASDLIGLDELAELVTELRRSKEEVMPLRGGESSAVASRAKRPCTDQPRRDDRGRTPEEAAYDRGVGQASFIWFLICVVLTFLVAFGRGH